MTVPSQASTAAPEDNSSDARSHSNIATPADAARAAKAAEAEDRAVDLKARFFNLRTAFSFLLGIAILVALFRFTDVQPGEILARFRQVDWRFFALAVLSYACTFPFRGLRWQVLLRNLG